MRPRAGRHALLLVLLLGLLRLGLLGRRRGDDRRGAATSSSSAAWTFAETITGFGLPWVTTLMPARQLDVADVQRLALGQARQVDGR